MYSVQGGPIDPKDIAEDRQFENLTQIWIEGDHYKYRAMRANGIDEKFITGDASDYEKFLKWAETVPYTLRNPLYHWTHLELKQGFGIADCVLNAATADSVYSRAGELLADSEYSVFGLFNKFNVLIFGHPITDPPGIIAFIISKEVTLFFSCPPIKLT